MDQNPENRDQDSPKELPPEELSACVKTLFDYAQPDLMKGLMAAIQGLCKGKNLGDIAQVSPSSMDRWYEQARNLYTAGQYEQAQWTFWFLNFMDNKDPKFAFGMAACMHMNKHYENAAATYQLCSLLDLNNPVPDYHAADCWLQLGREEEAIACLQSAIQKAADQPPFHVVKERCLMTLETLNWDKVGENEEENELEQPELEK